VVSSGKGVQGSAHGQPAGRRRRTASAVGTVQGSREEGDEDRDLFAISNFSRDCTVNINYLLFPGLK
jgi:hypothetical protein